MKTTKQQLTRVFRTLGGAGSGNFGHAGRPGEVGGSGEGNDGKSFLNMAYGRATAKRFVKLFEAAGVEPGQMQQAAMVLHGYFGDYSDRVNYDLRYKGEMGPDQELMNRIVTNAGPYQNKSDVVFRGLYFANEEKGKNFLDSLQKGAVITDRGFQSATSDKNVAHDFALQQEGVPRTGARTGIGVVVNIRGTKGVGMDVPDFLNEDEPEILLPAGTSYRVENVTREGKAWEVHAVLVKGRGHSGLRGNDVLKERLLPRKRTFAERMANPEGLVVEAV